MSKIAQDEYDKVFQAFKNGEITQDEWFAYCQGVLSIILDENKDVMVRLKNR